MTTTNWEKGPLEYCESRTADGNDYEEHESFLEEVNKDAYEWFKNHKGNSGIKIRDTIYWRFGEALQIYNNKDLNGEILTCWYCKKEIENRKEARLHHHSYNIKIYFGSFGDQDKICCIVHNKCHLKLHGWI